MMTNFKKKSGVQDFNYVIEDTIKHFNQNHARVMGSNIDKFDILNHNSIKQVNRSTVNEEMSQNYMQSSYKNEYSFDIPSS